MSYYNTNHLKGAELTEALVQTGRQQEIILALYKRLGSATPDRIYKELLGWGKTYPITSVRRAITDLTAEGRLTKTDRMTDGMYGKPVHIWEYCPDFMRDDVY